MLDETCVQFLQWALPYLHMRWPGFRRVRGQVCKRLARRLQQLGLDSLEQYQAYLASHPDEWPVLDGLCQVTISRFYRDKMMFAFLADEVLPELASQVIKRGGHVMKVWCIGCASGEEPYSVNMVWQFQCRPRYPDIRLQIMATDANADLLQRMQQACYAYSTIKNLPPAWRESAFVQQGDLYCLLHAFRRDIQRYRQDVREAVPAESFDLILCRNLVFTYYEEALQRKTLARIQQQLCPGGALVLGIHEQLPADISGLSAWSDKLRVYRKTQ